MLSAGLTSFTEHLPEDGHNGWPKHVGGYAVYNKINLLIIICTCWLILIINHHCMVMNDLKLNNFGFFNIKTD